MVNTSGQACAAHSDRSRLPPQDHGLSGRPQSSIALGHANMAPNQHCIPEPGYLEDKLERALLRTSGVSSTEVTRGVASTRLSLSDAVSPSTFASGSDSYTAEKQKRRRSKMLGRILRSTRLL